MNGLLFQGPGSIEFSAQIPDPIVEKPTDAVIRVTQTGLCGSDLHPYEGREAARPGVVPGHEAVGEIIATGHEVRDFNVGDRVLVPFTASCGTCHACRDGLSARCSTGELFGWGDPVDLDQPAVHGGQAALMRVPQADGTLVLVPDKVTDEQAVLLTDNIPTGWYAARRSLPIAGEPAMVVGLGSVGLAAVIALRSMGAGPIFGTDPVDDRMERAERLGAVPVRSNDLPGGLPSVVEAAGARAAQRAAFESVGPGGTLSVIAVQTDDQFPFTPVEAYDANVTIRFGRAPARSILDDIMPIINAGALQVPADVIVTHPRQRLEEGPDLYRAFSARQPGLVKATFTP